MAISEKDIQEYYEDMSHYPIFNKPKGVEYNKDKYVMVRVLCSKILPIDFESEIVDRTYYKDNELPA